MDKEKFKQAEIRAKAAEIYVRELLPQIVRARTEYFKNRSPENKSTLEQVEGEGARRLEAFNAIGAEMEEALGIPAEVLDALTKQSETLWRSCAMVVSHRRKRWFPPSADTVCCYSQEAV